MAKKKLMLVFGANTQGLLREMDKATKSLNKMSRDAQKSFGPVMDGIGRSLAYVGTAAAAGFGAAVIGSVKGAASLEAYRNTLNTVMKDQKKAGETMAWAVDFANKTPFETDSVVQATVKLQAYGLEAQKVMLSIGNMAAVMNKDIDQAVEAVADAQTGELERLKEFGITKAMIVQKGNEIMRGVELVNNKGQIVDQENFNKALFALMDERFKGGMEIQATSFNGLWSTVVGTFKTTLSTMAGISATGEVTVGGFFDNLKKKMQYVIDKLNEWQKNGKLQEWANSASQTLSTFWNVASVIFDGIINFGSFIINNWPVIGPILAGILAGFLAFRTATAVVNGMKLAMAGLNLVMNLNPISLIVLGIAALVAIGVLLIENWDKIKAKAGELWAKIEEHKALFIILTGGIGAIILAGVELYKHWDTVKLKAGELWIKIKETWDNVKTKTTTIWNTVKDTIRNSINSVIGAINAFITGLNEIEIEVPEIEIPFVGTFGGWTIGLPDIGTLPMLAEGGIVNRPTLVMAGEAGPEAIVPLNNTSVGGSPTINLYFNGADPESNWKYFKRQMALSGIKIPLK